MNRSELRPNAICDVYTILAMLLLGFPRGHGDAKITRASVSSIIYSSDVQLGLSHRAKPQPIYGNTDGRTK